LNNLLTILFVGGFFITMGLVNVIATDCVWKWQQSLNKSKGIVSDRTPEWDRRTRFQGYVMIVFGIVMTAILTCSSLAAPQQ
jgi:hypothetical protein